MKIEILGTGCAKCNKLHALVEKTVAEIGADAEIVKVENLDDILNYGVALTPALVIEGAVKTTGRIPKAAQIEIWIREASAGK